MTVLLVSVVVGYLAGRLLCVVTRPVFAAPALSRLNYRERTVATGVGVLLPLTAAMVESVRAVAGAAGVGGSGAPAAGRLLALLAASAFALVGFVDDVAGDAGSRGFRGHLRALLAGRVTTGLVKLVVGGGLALLLVAPAAAGSPGRLLADGLLVALAANLGNLLDRAPGRTVKAGAAAFLLLALMSSWSGALAGVALVVGAALGLLADDLGERVMLGDAGANALGAVLGLGVVMACSPGARDAVALVLVAMTVASELVSFSQVIDALPPLRAADRAGRRMR